MPIYIKNLHKSFSNLTIFNNFSMDIKDEKITCILGPSGCGKTTLVNMITGLITPDSGVITGSQAEFISYVFQEHRLLKWMTVWENIDFVLKDIYSKKERQKIIKEYLQIVDLYEFKNYLPNKLSGGMKQRVSIARAFAYPSNLLIMDEPFKGLDMKLKLTLIKSFISLWNAHRRTVIFVTHDIDEAVYLGDEIYVLDKNPIEIKKHINIDMDKDKRSLNNSKLKKIREQLIQL